MGWLTNPRKAAYNRVYHKITFDLLKPRARGKAMSQGAFPAMGLVAVVGYLLYLVGVLG